VISLSQRLLSSKHMAQMDEKRRQSAERSMPTPTLTTMDIDSTVEQKPNMASVGDLLKSPKVSQSTDVPIPEDGAGPSPSSAALETDPPKTKTPDLRVQMPPVPAFDNTGLSAPSVVTPLSGSSSVVQSPFSTVTTSPFSVSGINGISAHPSPVKKKLSLSDYTKSRMNKAAVKVAGGSAIMKPSLATPDESKMDISLETPVVPKTEENMVATPVTTNGIS
jgi:hypothetical protein